MVKGVKLMMLEAATRSYQVVELLVDAWLTCCGTQFCDFDPVIQWVDRACSRRALEQEAGGRIRRHFETVSNAARFFFVFSWACSKHTDS